MARLNHTKNILLEVRDLVGFAATESQSYSRFPAEVRDDASLSFGARLTYSMLVGFAIDSNRVYPGQQLLADRLGVSVRSVRTYIDELRLKNLLRVERRGLTKTNVYILAVWVGHDAAVERKQASAPDRKHTSALDRKHASDNNEENDNNEIYDEEMNKPRAKVPRSQTASAVTKSHAQELRRSAQAPKIDALCAAAGIERSLLSQRQIDDWVQVFSTSPITEADVSALVAYFLTQPWYRDHRERITAKAVVQAWPGWVASGRPSREHRATSRAAQASSSASADQDSFMQRFAQQRADETGEEFFGVMPSYWRSQNGGGS